MELLAPAGSFEALVAAVQSGADAVYIGGSEFSARRSAANFTLEEIEKAADYCHIRNVKLHVAANILIKEKETASFLEYVKKIGRFVDAIIIQDMGMAKKIREMYPEIPLHASTQMTVASVEAVKRLEEMGISRVVLARELSLNQIENICKNTTAEIEVFAHGAICMCYSGQCLMSSIIGGRSGNRGMCAQPCRLPYEIDEKKGYLLSPKDLCALSHLKRLKDMGVASIKIEGRLKRKEYVSTVCGIYRKYIDNPEIPDTKDLNILLDAFNRSGFTDGYLMDRLGKDMMCYSNPSNIGENKFTEWAKAHSREDAEFKKTGIYLSATLKKDECLKLSCWDDDGHFAEVIGEYPAEIANNRPLSPERMLKQLEKLGATPFISLDTHIDIEDGITIPVSEINKVRRDLIDAFKTAKCEKREISENPEPTSRKPEQSENIKIVCQVTSMEQAKACIDMGIDEIYADTPLANKLVDIYKDAKIIAKLPPVFCCDKAYTEPKSEAVLVSNIGQIRDDKLCYGDFRLNVTNSATVDFYSNLKRVTLSPELNLKELEPISDGTELIAYGRIPLMVMENCPLKALGKCQNFKNNQVITDRMGEEFPMKCNEGCTIEILNSKPIYLADKPEILKKLRINAIRLIFTVENGQICGKIIDSYKKMICGEKGENMPENTFTRGHFYRGTE